MASSFCGICEARHKTQAASFWCSECDEGLCIVCHDHHSISKSSRLHKVIPIENYNKLPLKIANIVNNCPDHEMNYTNYCPHHEKLCCPACISNNHKSCTGLQLLQDVIKTAKTSALLDSIELTVNDIKSNIKNIIEDRQRNIAKIHDQRQRHQDKIKQIRNEINAHLDMLEQKMLKEIDASENKAKTEIDHLVDNLLGKAKVADDLVQNISAIKMYASDLQAFIGSKSIEIEVKKEENYLLSLTEDSSLNQLLPQLKLDDKLSNIDSTIHSFGSVTIERKSPLVVLKREDDKQAQILSVIPQIVPKLFEEITLSQISKLSFRKGDLLKRDFIIRGITTLPSGKIVVADSGNNSLIIFNTDCLLDKSIRIPLSNTGYGPFDVTYVKDDLVAVSTLRAIHIVNITSEMIEEIIATNDECRGIAYTDGTLIYWLKSNGMQKLQISNRTKTTFVIENDISDRYGISARSNKIYATRFNDDIVSCYTIHGMKLWDFKISCVLSNPTGIAVDNNSNVYVASYSENCVIILSPDGRKFKTVLTSKDGLKQPTALHFDETKNNLLVANINQPVFVYHVS